MNVVVLLRAVADEEALAEPRPLVVDGPSLVALALALSWKALHPGALLTGIACGPAGWEAPLREALALDLDSLTRVDATEGADVVATAHAIAAALRADVSLVVAGSAATDHGSGLLAPALAEALGWALVASVTGLESRDGAPAVRVRGEAGVRRLLRLPLPAVLEAAPAPAPALYPKLAKKLAARKAVIPVVPMEVGLAALRFEGYGPARPVTRTLFRPSATARPAERMRQLMAGGMTQRAGKALSAESGVAGQLADLLEAQGFIRRG